MPGAGSPSRTESERSPVRFVHVLHRFELVTPGPVRLECSATCPEALISPPMNQLNVTPSSNPGAWSPVRAMVSNVSPPNELLAKNRTDTPTRTLMMPRMTVLLLQTALCRGHCRDLARPCCIAIRTVYNAAGRFAYPSKASLTAYRRCFARNAQTRCRGRPCDSSIAKALRTRTCFALPESGAGTAATASSPAPPAAALTDSGTARCS